MSNRVIRCSWCGEKEKHHTDTTVLVDGICKPCAREVMRKFGIDKRFQAAPDTLKKEDKK